jgi:DNA polymerase III, subunit gamma and tau
MSYIALYRKWRPSVFEDVVEQEHVVKTLRYSVSNDRIAHAYLFCGTRGTGKTTMAHILSRAINCLSPKNGDPCNECEICREILSGSSMDVLEMDAASNNSVDNVREIRDEVIYAPSHARYKVYIIDEVHMLSTGAFNALLKTLEEPPAHVVFILATTEPHKLPATILSRCQRFDFRRITVDSIIERLSDISTASNVNLDKDALRLIAKMSDGALRDAISLLDQCISLGKTEITFDDVLSVIGIVNDTFIASLVDSILDRDITNILNSVDRLVMDGKDIPHFVSDLILYFRNLLICNITNNPGDIIDLPADVLDTMKKQCNKTVQDEIMYIIKELSTLEYSLKWATNPRIMLEVTLVKLCETNAPLTDSNLIERIEMLEKKLNSGLVATIPNSQPVPESKSKVPQPVANNKSPAALKAESTPNSTISKQDYMAEWQKIMDELKSLGRRTIHSFLIDTKAVRLSENLVGIIFNSSNQFGRTILSKAEHLEVLEEISSRILGVPVKVKCLDEESLDRSLQKEVSSPKDDLLEKAKSIAEKAGLPLEIIEE